MVTRTNIAIGVVITLLILVLMPVNLHLDFIPYFDKVAHFLACAAMTFAFVQFVSIRKAVLITFLLFTGAEWLQYYLPNRGASLGDFLANTAGILTFWFLYQFKPLTKRIRAFIIPN